MKEGELYRPETDNPPESKEWNQAFQEIPHRFYEDWRLQTLAMAGVGSSTFIFISTHIGNIIEIYKPGWVLTWVGCYAVSTLAERLTTIKMNETINEAQELDINHPREEIPFYPIPDMVDLLGVGGAALSPAIGVGIGFVRGVNALNRHLATETLKKAIEIKNSPLKTMPENLQIEAE